LPVAKWPTCRSCIVHDVVERGEQFSPASVMRVRTMRRSQIAAAVGEARAARASVRADALRRIPLDETLDHLPEVAPPAPRHAGSEDVMLTATGLRASIAENSSISRVAALTMAT
jgi:hypothetical protein